MGTEGGLDQAEMRALPRGKMSQQPRERVRSDSKSMEVPRGRRPRIFYKFSNYSSKVTFGTEFREKGGESKPSPVSTAPS